jgi:hypothetical protein
MVSNIKATVRKDFTGSDVTVGSEVIYMELGYRNFITGTIITMSDKKCTIMNAKGRKNTQFYYQIIKANRG